MKFINTLIKITSGNVTMELCVWQSGKIQIVDTQVLIHTHMQCWDLSG
jgi:hypothetical protein